MTLPPPVTPTTLADLLDRLGHVPAARIRTQPPPGTATEDDLFRPENRRCELVDGVLVEKPEVTMQSGFLTTELICRLGDFVRPRRLGLLGGSDFMARMVDGNVRLPDIAFYSWPRLSAAGGIDQRLAPIAPDLAVEVMSDSNTADEMLRKRDEYFASGTRLVWEVEPVLRLVRVYSDTTTFTTVAIDGTLTGEPVLPGFVLRLRDLFDSIDPPSTEAVP